MFSVDIPLESRTSLIFRNFSRNFSSGMKFQTSTCKTSSKSSETSRTNDSFQTGLIVRDLQAVFIISNGLDFTKRHSPRDHLKVIFLIPISEFQDPQILVCFVFFFQNAFVSNCSTSFSHYILDLLIFTKTHKQ